VPSYILLGLPAGNGGVNLQGDVFSTFSAKGLDTSNVGGTISFSQAATIVNYSARRASMGSTAVAHRAGKSGQRRAAIRIVATPA
jgi:hypothetical protein